MDVLEFVNKLGSFYGCNNICATTYKSKSIGDYIEEVRKFNKEPKLDDECVKFFRDLNLNITDNFTINIVYLKIEQKPKEYVYNINIIKNKEVVYNMMFKYDIKKEEEVELLINSLCKAMYLKCYRYVNINFIVAKGEYN